MTETGPGNRLPDQGLETFTPEEWEKINAAKARFGDLFHRQPSGKDIDNKPVAKTKENKRGCLSPRNCAIGIVVIGSCCGLATYATIHGPDIIRALQK